MRRPARSDKRAEIGSRVFPFRSPPPAQASMPTVGTRRSTRVFVPKQQQRLAAAADGDPARVLRSGKRIALSMTAEEDDDGNEWLRVLGDRSDPDPNLNLWRKDERMNEWKEERKIEKKKKFGTVYSRKRPRTESSLSDVENHRRFGVVFERKHRRKGAKVAPLVDAASGEASIVDDSPKGTELRAGELDFGDCSKTFDEKLGILDSELWSGSKCSPLVLTVLVDSSVSNSFERCGRLLVSVMKWMRRSRVEFGDLVDFLLRGSVGRVFSMNGIRFLPISHQTKTTCERNSIAGCGFCKIFGARDSIPLLSVGYTALPSYFKCLHAIIILGSQYLPTIPRAVHSVPMLRNSLMAVPCEQHGGDSSEMDFSGAESTVPESPDVDGDVLLTARDSSVISSRSAVVINGSRYRKHKGKRSSLKNSGARNISSIASRFSSFRSVRNSSVSSTAKRGFAVGPISVKRNDSCLSDLFSSREESDIASSPGSSLKLRKSPGLKSPLEKIKEQRSALAEVRQNIDSACCNANILVIDTEKCWRENGARVMLEMSSSQEWFIAVKRGDTTRFLHKPHDLKPCVVNRFTHAYMWSGDEGWKLEFCDKWDWYVFKELHMECQDRNTQDVSVKVIPVPGVREVYGYEDDVVPSFVRPDIYIHITKDEVGRALGGETSNYDMDLIDEEWLRYLNSSPSDAQDAGPSHVSEETFERIMFAFEKDAFNCPDDAYNKERALDLCQELGTRDMVSAIYDYWLKKRKQKRTPLARVFQGPPLRRTPLIQKPVLRKKRSLKRQHSQAERNQGGRGKPDLVLQAHQVAIRKVKEAEAAASRAVDVAAQLRTRAQMLMSNADLLAYKASMALRIAETIRVSSASSASPESLDLDSSILFD